MTHNSRTKGYGLAVMTLAMLAQVACTQPTADDEEADETHLNQYSAEAVSSNAVSSNAVSSNAVSSNAVSSNAVSSNALTTEALNSDSIVIDALKDPNARELLKYVVSCALPADAHIDVEVDGVTYGFDGSLGVAPEWGEEGGSCDEECRSWVSGCVISRIDYLHQEVLISLRGANDGLKTTPQERAKYSHIEATYYGDIFSQPQQIFACLPPGKTGLPRVCGPSLDDCIVKVQGNCEDLCDAQRSDGGYPNCREANNQGKVKKGSNHLGSVTVFLK